MYLFQFQNVLTNETCILIKKKKMKRVFFYLKN